MTKPKDKTTPTEPKVRKARVSKPVDPAIAAAKEQCARLLAEAKAKAKDNKILNKIDALLPKLSVDGLSTIAENIREIISGGPSDSKTE